ncbi:MAG: Maf family protein [Deferrisomatales bacterium]|nr:Maf family protein [Deferrisomatales bacterium]
MSLLILASASPRRRELLDALGVPFEVRESCADETLPPGVPLEEGLAEVARRKARDVAHRSPPGAWVLGADTAVVLRDRVFGKPRDRAEAEGFLRALSGMSHRVLTGVGLLGPTGERSVTVATQVRFRTLSEAEIAWYASLPEPYDKAGGYAIQGSGAFLVAEIRGSCSNVVGLPMAETSALLTEAGLTPWSADPPSRVAHG